MAAAPAAGLPVAAGSPIAASPSTAATAAASSPVSAGAVADGEAARLGLSMRARRLWLKTACEFHSALFRAVFRACARLAPQAGVSPFCRCSAGSSLCLDVLCDICAC